MRVRVTVVIADDSRVMRKMLRAMIEQEGAVVVAEAPDAKSAVKMCQEHQPRFLVFDANLETDDHVSISRLVEKVSPGTEVHGFGKSQPEETILRLRRVLAAIGSGEQQLN